MSKSAIYTKTGDKGKTSLVGGSRVSKTDIRLEAYGTVDELNSHIGLLIQKLDNLTEVNLLHSVQNQLFVIGSYLATDTSLTSLPEASLLNDAKVELLELAIDRVDAQIPPLSNFILPGGGESAAVSHICRTICRRAERRIYEIAEQYEVDQNIFAYMNRLSDYLFVLARLCNIETGGKEIFWDKGCK